MPKYVVFYESADDVRSKAPAHFPAHRARWQEYRDRGTLLMIGTFANPQEVGSMGIFTTREAAEESVSASESERSALQMVSGTMAIAPQGHSAAQMPQPLQ